MSGRNDLMLSGVPHGRDVGKRRSLRPLPVVLLTQFRFDPIFPTERGLVDLRPVGRTCVVVQRRICVRFPIIPRSLVCLEPREVNLQTCPVGWMSGAIVVGLALGVGTVVAADSEANATPAEGADTDVTVKTPKQTRDPWFDLDKLDVNIYGLSYHPDREAVHQKNLDNQFNPGIGLHYTLTDSPRGNFFVEAGAYYDSGSAWAQFAGLGYQFKVSRRWRIGGAVAVVNSPTYNRGTTFVGMIPLITYDLGRIKLNAVYFPKIANYNEVEIFGFYLSFPFSAWR